MKENREVTGPGVTIGRPPIVRFTMIQIAILVLLSSSLLLVGKVSSYSFLLGGLIAVLPQLYFAARLFRDSGAGAAHKIARAGYAGQVGKFALSAAGFALVFAAVRPLHSEVVFIGFIGMMIIQYTVSWIHLRSTAGEEKESIHGS